MRIGVQVFVVPFVCGVPEHKSLVTCAEILLVFVSVNGVSDFTRLSLYVHNYIHSVAVKSCLWPVVSDLIANITGNLLKVYLLFGYSCLSK